MKIDLTKFTRSLPYAAEAFGIYQPMLGWRSKRTSDRITDGMRASFSPVMKSLMGNLVPALAVDDQDGQMVHVAEIALGRSGPPAAAYVNSNIDSFVARAIVRRINEDGLDLSDEASWDRLVSPDALREMLAEVRGEPALAQDTAAFFERNGGATPAAVVDHAMPYNRESLVAGALNTLFQEHAFDELRRVFTLSTRPVDVRAAMDLQRFIDPLQSFDPGSDLDRVALSPVGMVHLFREYFFEFDTFLGSPVEHIWLSPGASVELIEVSTRKTTVEKARETEFQSVVGSETGTVDQDEISKAVRNENQNNTKLASSVTAGATGGATTPIYSATAHVDVTGSYGFDSAVGESREHAFKDMHQQTHKLTSEITNNFKTTFRTVTETTDTSSRRYVLANDTKELKNFELRRKMRQIGVQVQSVGTQLCWQTYVDVPGQDLGLANLVHIAEPPDYANLKAPDPVPPPANQEKDFTVTLGFQGTGHDNDTNVHYIEDSPTSDFGHPDNGDVNDKIRIRYPNYPAPVLTGYDLADVRLVAVAENKLCVPEFTPVPPSAFDIRLRTVNYDGDAVTVQVKLVYTANTETKAALVAANSSAIAAYTEEKKRIAQHTILKEARDRVDAAAKVTPRKVEELREEERIVVYRELMKDLLKLGSLPDEPRVRHVLSELISSMFDTDRMLYFVAPDWWKPRKHYINQQVISAPGPLTIYANKVFTKNDIVTWGSVGQSRHQNYFITETSEPARLGSSLGWTMQLDGDNLRNAFLNAPWVKAVVPIRPGKEMAALNWLTHAGVEGSDGLDTRYQGLDQAEIDAICATLEGHAWTEQADIDRYTDFAATVAQDPNVLTIRDALKQLAIRIAETNASVMTPMERIVDGEPRKYLPTERVYEHGFDPLASSFEVDDTDPFATFAQWVNIMPTDQVVAVEVAYDPKTGMQL